MSNCITDEKTTCSEDNMGVKLACVWFNVAPLFFNVFIKPAKHGQQIGIMSESALSSPASSTASWLSHFWFPLDNFCRDASISFKVYRRVKHHKIQDKFKSRGNLQNFDRAVALFGLIF